MNNYYFAGDIDNEDSSNSKLFKGSQSNDKKFGAGKELSNADNDIMVSTMFRFKIH